ncbi:bifunctional adenosylcobinamide kinase/adenosylcobinamide-phosphate guanylyltransferase [Salinispira pacifica]
MNKKLITIIGGARSGKSSFAVDTALRHGRRVLFVATAEGSDEEMIERIDAHRRQRPASFTTVETPTQVGDRIAAEGEGFDTVIIDCMTLLVSNLMGHGRTPAERFRESADAEVDSILHAYKNMGATFLVVTNEVGLGVVPPYPAGRLYRDVLGRVNRRLVEESDPAILLVAGIPIDLNRITTEVKW